MAVNARKLKSGNYRALVFDYKDIKGKKHYKSFTAPTKKEAEKLAAEFAFNHNSLANEEESERKIIVKPQRQITVEAAIKDYIEIKRSVLSPSTITSYVAMLGRYEGIKDYALNELNTIIVQKWISILSHSLSPKSVKNTYALFNSAVKMYDKEICFDISLPAKIKPDLYTPGNDDVKKLLCSCNSPDLEICILLAVYGPLRRGEIAALTYGDIKGDTITINKAYSKNDSGEWVLKSPKTYSSYRTIEFPHFVIKKILAQKKDKSGNDEIISGTADSITRRFCKLRDSVGLYNIRFHDLRHYSASILHTIGIPDKYIVKRGGWQSDYTMKRVYQDTIDDEQKRIDNKINSYFSSL